MQMQYLFFAQNQWVFTMECFSACSIFTGGVLFWRGLSQQVKYFAADLCVKEENGRYLQFIKAVSSHRNKVCDFCIGMVHNLATVNNHCNWQLSVAIV